jgi:hypothetical protein
MMVLVVAFQPPAGADAALAAGGTQVAALAGVGEEAFVPGYAPAS